MRKAMERASSIRLSLRKVFICLFLMSLFGCAATFRGNELAKIDTFPPKSEIVVHEIKPSVLLDISWHTKLSPFAAKPYYNESFEQSVYEITKESDLFGRVSLKESNLTGNIAVKESETHKTDYKIEIDMLNSGNWFASQILGTISGLTLTIIPAYAKDTYIMSATVSDSNGTLKKYEYKDHLNSWIELLLLPVAPFTKNVGNEVRMNMLKHFYSDLTRDGLISPTVSGTIKASTE